MSHKFLALVCHYLTASWAGRSSLCVKGLQYPLPDWPLPIGESLGIGNSKWQQDQRVNTCPPLPRVKQPPHPGLGGRHPVPVPLFSGNLDGRLAMAFHVAIAAHIEISMPPVVESVS